MAAWSIGMGVGVAAGCPSTNAGMNGVDGLCSTSKCADTISNLSLQMHFVDGQRTEIMFD
ncbi:hypothetical protein SYNPS1DRAFT_25050 [Syncephalis pseudoplumigaleata]|uniref:Uncharacterized protein n=1 Tax=Syncephalis pseudoplumigaleata TaxID=1712513 RepID=A0A4P9YVP2_9FUNG|nr:hypothetical protein SYNPS1DRAFT_25050 [Syncephalis pseudoplumigaleata]|eukprot:RKP22990.1 hypothetical protein SYNPS1DRAFT_25050 [Syncephalis pseudoplumigaleata]